jgi:hypothetical protein
VKILPLRQKIMKVPGRAWLQFEVEKHGNATAIRQTAIFDPAGMLRSIIKAIAGDRGTASNISLLL